MGATAIRSATEADVPVIFAIYDHEVEHGTATFDTTPSTAGKRAAWWAAHRNARYPVRVAEREGVVAGWSSLSPWSDRCGYNRAAEVSVYVHRDHRGHGIGRALLADLIDVARSTPVRVLLARITSESAVSLRLHEELGFQRIGTMRRVGEKFGRILDVELLDLHLDG